jgi:hypothetical protein
MQRHFKFLALSLATAALTAGCATKPKPSQSIEHIMEAGFKGKESLSAKVSKGEASAAELASMVEFTYQLTLNTPSKGDLKSWAEKTTALHAAAKSLAANQPGALDAWKAAVNCKACHSVHKPD